MHKSEKKNYIISVTNSHHGESYRCKYRDYCGGEARGFTISHNVYTTIPDSATF